MPTLLYYPLVEPPQAVIHQALLYWDDFASVVPRDSDVYEGAVSRELKDLKERGLYHPISLGTQYRRPLDDMPHLEVLVGALRELAARSPSPQYSVLDAFLLRSKLGYCLEEEIIRLGLGRRLQSSHGQYRAGLAVSREVQLLLIGALAQQVACTSDARAYTPYTDQRSAYETSLRPMAPGFGVAAWRVELGRLLPMPAPGTPTSEILAFRDRYATERERLMGATQTMLSNLSREWEHPADVLQRMQVELRQARDDYQSAARASRTAWVYRSISVTVGVATAAASALVVPDLGWVAGIAGSIAFNIATREVRPLRYARKEHPFTYLSQVDRELA
ncbi:hypothetical protein [Streptomyces sp. Ag109_G2-15]|uniref:hypothetical protein n=1 Tax=Streptomyces sp. Ag109_G2-15 TaxID=1938850 RepID=UPI000BD9379B|nr:hypothetical protein [Streptomyces sp. Ag109_G2-15]SOD86501.1 hypothetical protein SAMN06272765_3960 [Streptomyces sp. Ag109_G2-15]